MTRFRHAVRRMSSIVKFLTKFRSRRNIALAVSPASRNFTTRSVTNTWHALEGHARSLRGGRLLSAVLLSAVLMTAGASPLFAQAVNGQQRNGQQAKGVRRAAAPANPRAPFQLTPQQQRMLDAILLAWEKNSGGIKTFECDFRRWEYQPVLGPRNRQNKLVATTIAKGQIKYLKPDKGLFRVNETLYWDDKTQKHIVDPTVPDEHWVCDGKFVYEVSKRRKAVIKKAIPPEMQGKHIIEGPLPFFLFGAEAAKLKARNFMRLLPPNPRFANNEVWLEAYPRWRRDAANYKKSQLIMSRKTFLPIALRLYSPNEKDYSVFEFTNVKINNLFFRKSILGQPKIPRGFRLINQNPLAAAGANPVQRPVARQGARPATPKR